MTGHILALCGGVGGAKLAFGLAQVLPAEDLTIIVNTGDDFEHLGLHISPDIDTVAYTLAGLADRERGWGVSGETWNFMDSLRRLGGEDWFRLGDRDLAMHVERTLRLRAGKTLSEATSELCAALGVRRLIAPMSNESVRTILLTDAGELTFQQYFVAQQCRPVVREIWFRGCEDATPSPAFLNAMDRSDLAAVVICPSNPFLSIDPIMSMPEVKAAISRTKAPVVAVSPIVGGAAIKGPTSKLMAEFGARADVIGVADHYAPMLDGLVIDYEDRRFEGSLAASGLRSLVTGTVMRSDADRVRLARETLAFVPRISESAPRVRHEEG